MDSENIDFGNIQNNKTTKIFKISLFIFLIFILLSSQIFIEKLESWNKSLVYERNVTENGIIIQGVLLSIGYIVINELVSNDYI